MEIQRYREDRKKHPNDSYSFFLNGYKCKIKWRNQWNGYVKPPLESIIPKKYTGENTELKGEYLPNGVHGGFTDGYLGFDTGCEGDMSVIEYDPTVCSRPTHFPDHGPGIYYVTPGDVHYWSYEEVFEHLNCITLQLREVDENPPLIKLVKAAEF